MRRLTTLLAALIMTTLLSHNVNAQSFPSRPLTIFMPLAPGTGMDVIARLYGEQLSQALGQPVVIDNRPGGLQVIAVNAALSAPSDGHTLVALTSGAAAINATLVKKLSYDTLKDFTPISLYAKSPFVLVVNPALPVQSVPDLIKLAKERKLSFSSSGVGLAPHLAGEYIKQRYGLDITHVPYRNSPQSIADVAAGHVDFAFAEAGASIPLIKSGQLRALAVSSTTRFPTLPDVPTFAEASGIADFEAVSWHILMVRSGVPQEISNRLHTEMNRIMSKPETREKILALGLIPLAPLAIDETRNYVRLETEKWGALLKQLGLDGSQ